MYKGRKNDAVVRALASQQCDKLDLIFLIFYFERLLSSNCIIYCGYLLGWIG